METNPLINASKPKELIYDSRKKGGRDTGSLLAMENSPGPLSTCGVSCKEICMRYLNVHEQGIP